MKKITSVFMCVLLLLSLSIIAFAKNPVELTLTNATVYAGDEFELKLYISDNSQMSGAVIDINYDSAVLEFVSAEAGAILDSEATASIKNFNTDKSSYVRFTYMAPSSSVTAEGILLSVRFKALETAYGESSVSISIPYEKDFVDSKLETIEYKVNNSKVEIMNDDVSGNLSNTEEFSSSVDDESNSSVSYSESTSENAEDNTNENNNTFKLIIGLIVAGAVILVGVATYIVYEKNKKRRGNAE